MFSSIRSVLISHALLAMALSATTLTQLAGLVWGFAPLEALGFVCDWLLLLDVAHALRDALSRLPQIEGLELRVSKVPERGKRLENQIAKRPRQSELLREHLRVLEQEPLFVGVRTRSWLRNSSFRNGWLSPAVKIMDENALRVALDEDAIPPKPLGDIEPHELRHTYASLAVSEGANVKARQRALGHEKASVTLDVYADLFEDDLDDVAERLDWKVRAMMTSADLPPSKPVAYDDPMWEQ